MIFGLPRLYAALGAAIVAALLLGWVARIDSLRSAHKKEAAACAEKLHVTQDSLDLALAQISDNNRRIREAADKLNEAKQQAAADQARADARWDAQKGRVAALEASARDNTQEPCKVSQRASQALEGL